MYGFANGTRFAMNWCTKRAIEVDEEHARPSDVVVDVWVSEIRCAANVEHVVIVHVLSSRKQCVTSTVVLRRR